MSSVETMSLLGDELNTTIPHKILAVLTAELLERLGFIPSNDGSTTPSARNTGQAVGEQCQAPCPLSLASQVP